MAEDTLSQMTSEEKYTLLRGVGWTCDPLWNCTLPKFWYVGNTAPIKRLNIPSLNMQDAAGGFRPYFREAIGTVTCWPSLLSVAATWDADLTYSFAQALGTEFAGKGANGILGPSVNVQRIARNGRNFEYISGEDPYLGSILTKKYVEGVQSKGVFSVVKHWVFNEQETNRNTESSNVDDKTAWELYYPPFIAAVKAGVSAVMCSYNRVNDRHSCGNKRTLELLKGDMGFKGFVQSDWWASNSMSLPQGLDQEMPGNGTHFFNSQSLSDQDPELVDKAAMRVLAVIHRMQLIETTKCSPPNCATWFKSNVSGPKHVALARSIAAESVVLLKNRHDVLPLVASKDLRTIAIIGKAAVAKPFNPDDADQGGGDWWFGDYYSGGGSGHVVADRVVSPLDGIKQRATEAGIRVIESTTRNTTDAIAASSVADVTIIVGATTSGESVDRSNLNLDDNVDDLIEAVAPHASRTIVLMQIPGAVVMPWRNSVDAILAMFLGGQETGTAWADVLFGSHAPTGRLPIMMPETEADTISPNQHSEVAYTEGTATSYRNKNFKAAFPFGHGLTYTSFEYAKPTITNCTNVKASDVCVRINVQNVGAVEGKTVVQLYLELPSYAGQPAPILKGFHKTAMLMPGKTHPVEFRLSPQDMSFYDSRSLTEGFWVQAHSAVAHIGESSADVRHSVSFFTGADGLHTISFFSGKQIGFVHPRSSTRMYVGVAMVSVAIVLVLCSFIFVWRDCLAERSQSVAVEDDSESESENA
jgi:beta-glucosidase